MFRTEITNEPKDNVKADGKKKKSREMENVEQMRSHTDFYLKIEGCNSIPSRKRLGAMLTFENWARRLALTRRLGLKTDLC